MASNEEGFKGEPRRRTGDRKTKSVDLSSSEAGEGEGEGEYVVKHINARRPEPSFVEQRWLKRWSRRSGGVDQNRPEGTGV